MSVKACREDVWLATIKDRPGALAEILSGLAEAGVSLDFVIARRSRQEPGQGVAFLTPIEGDHQRKIAAELNLEKVQNLHGVRVDAPNEVGVGARIARDIASGGINLRGFSAAAIGDQAVVHLAFDSDRDAEKAVDLLNKMERV